MKQFKFDCDVEPSSPFTTLCRHVKSQFKSTCGSFILISFPINMEELKTLEILLNTIRRFNVSQL